jgi:hypothetical protein
MMIIISQKMIIIIVTAVETSNLTITITVCKVVWHSRARQMQSEYLQNTVISAFMTFFRCNAARVITIIT